MPLADLLSAEISRALERPFDAESIGETGGGCIHRGLEPREAPLVAELFGLLHDAEHHFVQPFDYARRFLGVGCRRRNRIGGDTGSQQQ